jgi:hypothetical protein
MRALLRATAAFLALTCPGSAGAGGSPIGFVSLPAQKSLAVIALPNGGRLARLPIPGKPAAVAASMNGRRVLVASPSVGAVTEIDGIHPRVLRVYHGFARPVAVAFDYEPPIGNVTPRYAFVLERADGTLTVLDLVRGRLASRLSVGTDPDRLAVDGTTLWVAHADRTLTRVDVTAPARPHLLETFDADASVAALVADPDSHAVFVASRRSGVVTRYLDGGARARLSYRRSVTGAPLVGLALAPPKLLIAAGRDGTLYVLHEQSGRHVSRLHLTAGIKAVDVYGGWLVARLPRRLALIAVPDGSMRTSVPLETSVGGFAWAVD